MKTTPRFHTIKFLYVQARFALFIGCFFCTAPHCGYAQTPGISGDNIVIRRISLEHVFATSVVLSITQDHRGFMWIGTQDGLCRFDGENFTNYNIFEYPTVGDNFTWVVCEDREGFIWAGTKKGLKRFDPITQTSKRFLHDDGDTSSLSHNDVRSIFEDRFGALWVGTGNGLNRLNRNKGTWTRYYPNPRDTSRPGDNFITTILEDRNGTFWIAGGDYLLRGGGAFNLDRESGKFTSVGPRVRVLSMYEDGSGDLWAGVAGPAFCRIDRTTGRFIRLDLPEKEKGSPLFQGVKSICEDRTGSLWLATWGWSLLRYEPRTSSFTRYSCDPDNPNTISSSALNRLFVDRTGLVWVGTERGGLNTISTKPFLHRRTIGKFLHPLGRVDALLEDRQGTLWVGASGNGVWRFDPATQKVTHVLPTALLGSIHEDNEGMIWITESGSVIKFDPRKNGFTTIWRIPARKGLTDRLHNTYIELDHTLWVSALSTLFRVSPDLRTYSVFVHDPHNPRSITAGQVGGVLEDRHGNIWVVTAEGLSMFDKDSESFTRFFPDGQESSVQRPNSWPNLHLDRYGTLWVGTLYGLYKFNDTTASFSRFAPTDSRVWPMIGMIQEDARGNFWFFAGHWMSKFVPLSGTFYSFDRSDGLENKEILHWSHTRLRSGELVFGTMDGILVFHPDSVRLSTTVPAIVITGIKKSNKVVDLHTASELLDQVTFEPGENVFSISFSALSYDMPEFNQYSYKLEEFDKGWIYCENRREAMYTNLDPGEYTFRVKGSNHDGVWNEAGAALTVIIKPAFWQTWWFRLGSLLALLGGGMFVYRREVTWLRKEKRIQEEFSQQLIEFQEAGRKRLAADLHDGLGQDLLVASNELQQFLEEKNLASQELNQVATLLQDSIDNVREIASNLHPHQLDRLGFGAAIEAMTENLSRVSRLAIDRSCDNIDHVMPKEVEIHVYRIVQEALANVARHASAKNVTLQVRKTFGSIEVTITDDGKGFDMGEAKVHKPSPRSPGTAHGFGLSSMSERARIIGATLTIDSAPGSGTTVHMSVPST